MIVKEELIINDVEFVKTYSDKGFFIKGGQPFGLYEEAIDLKELNREYEETDIPIKEHNNEEI